jgi:hypothetical protein
MSQKELIRAYMGKYMTSKVDMLAVFATIKAQK